MTRGIYAIRHIASGKRYIGKSVNIEHRFWCHKNLLSKPDRNVRQTNRHLWNAVRKYGLDAFAFEIVEVLEHADEKQVAERELYWMDHYKTCDRSHGYNLRRDSSTKMEAHIETRRLMSVSNLGAGNPNYGNRWDAKQRANMSVRMKAAHNGGSQCYGDEWRAKLAVTSSQIWKDEEKKRRMAAKVSKKKQKYDYEQYTKDGKLVQRFPSVNAIIEANPGYKWQNIYNVCHGYKPSYMGFVWKQVIKEWI